MVEPIIFFILILSILNLVYVGINFLRALLHSPPKRLVLGSGAILSLGLAISYILTFIFKL